MTGSGPPPPDGDVSRAATIIVIQVISFTVELVIVSLRLFVRTRITKDLGWDDLFIALALLCGFFDIPLAALNLHHGLGRHSYYLSSQQRVQIHKGLSIATYPFSLGTIFARLSICCFLLPIFATSHHHRRKRGLYAFIVFKVASNVILGILDYESCHPIQRSWDPSSPGTCWSTTSQNAISYCQGTVSIICDGILAILPIVFLWEVQISSRVKIGICCLMGLGIFSAICAIVRTSFAGSLQQGDSTYTTVNELVSVLLEQTFAVTAACLPTLRSLLKRKKHHSSHNRQPRSSQILDNPPYNRQQRLLPYNSNGMMPVLGATNTLCSSNNELDLIYPTNPHPFNGLRTPSNIPPSTKPSTKSDTETGLGDCESWYLFSVSHISIGDSQEWGEELGNWIRMHQLEDV